MAQVLFALILSPLAVFILRNSFVASFAPQVFGTSVFFYLVYMLRRKFGSIKPSIVIFFMETATLWLILETGGIYSSFFFLLYFVGFLIAFETKPYAVFFYVASVFIFFLDQILLVTAFKGYIAPFSLLFLSPLFYYFGKTFKKEAELTEYTKTLEETTHEASITIKEQVARITKEEVLSTKTRDQLKTIEKEAEELETETTNS